MLDCDYSLALIAEDQVIIKSISVSFVGSVVVYIFFTNKAAKVIKTICRLDSALFKTLHSLKKIFSS